jgi:hypothetical protein
MEVKQYSASKEFLRRLAIDAAEPAPVRIAASPVNEVIYLLEAKPGEQRVRGLALESAPGSSAPGGDSAEPKQSIWKTLFSKQILAPATYADFAPALDRKPPFKPDEKATVRLLPNPLFQDAPGSVELQAASDEHGSFLRTSAGLMLMRLTETPHLRWVVFGHDGNNKALTIFQSDGAVVEEFRVRKLANMMAFDAGEYELKR